MIEITNKRSSFQVKNETEKLTLSGECTINEQKMITSFNGSFTLEGNYVGSFYYNEIINGNINKNLNDIHNDIAEDACKLIDATVKEIKENI